MENISERVAGKKKNLTVSIPTAEEPDLQRTFCRKDSQEDQSSRDAPGTVSRDVVG